MAGINLDGEMLKTIEPLGYLDMCQLLRCAEIVITDSGGLQREAYFHRIPCVTLREETEWNETVEYGWNRMWTVPDYLTRREIPGYGTDVTAGRIIDILSAALVRERRATRALPLRSPDKVPFHGQRSAIDCWQSPASHPSMISSNVRQQQVRDEIERRTRQQNRCLVNEPVRIARVRWIVGNLNGDQERLLLIGRTLRRDQGLLRSGQFHFGNRALVGLRRLNSFGCLCKLRLGDI